MLSSFSPAPPLRARNPGFAGKNTTLTIWSGLQSGNVLAKDEFLHRGKHRSGQVAGGGCRSCASRRTLSCRGGLLGLKKKKHLMMMQKEVLVSVDFQKGANLMRLTDGLCERPSVSEFCKQDVD